MRRPDTLAFCKAAWDGHCALHALWGPCSFVKSLVRNVREGCANIRRLAYTRLVLLRHAVIADTVHLPYAMRVHSGVQLDDNCSMLEILSEMYVIKLSRLTSCSSLTIYSSLSLSAVHAIACPVSSISAHETNSIPPSPYISLASPYKLAALPPTQAGSLLQAMQW